ncbi:MAG: hypothetical protein ACWGQW_04795 [bacterium]
MTVGAYYDPIPKLFTQGLYDESATQLQRIGTIRALDDGRVFAYARAGASALAVAKLTSTAVVAANHIECVVADTAIGATRIYITLGATAAAANLYKDGFIHINKNTGIGHLYKIRGHAAIGSGGSGYLELYDPIRVATASSAEGTLTKHPQDGTLVMATTQVAAPAGVPPIAVTASYYYWNQVKGVCSILTEGTIVVGNDVSPGTTAPGAVKASTTTEIVGAVGRVLNVNITAEYSLINLAIPGY